MDLSLTSEVIFVSEVNNDDLVHISSEGTSKPVEEEIIVNKAARKAVETSKRKKKDCTSSETGVSKIFKNKSQPKKGNKQMNKTESSGQKRKSSRSPASANRNKRNSNSHSEANENESEIAAEESKKSTEPPKQERQVSHNLPTSVSQNESHLEKVEEMNIAEPSDRRRENSRSPAPDTRSYISSEGANEPVEEEIVVNKTARKAVETSKRKKKDCTSSETGVSKISKNKSQPKKGNKQMNKTESSGQKRKSSRSPASVNRSKRNSNSHSEANENESEIAAEDSKKSTESPKQERQVSHNLPTSESKNESNLEKVEKMNIVEPSDRRGENSRSPAPDTRSSIISSSRPKRNGSASKPKESEVATKDPKNTKRKMPVRSHPPTSEMVLESIKSLKMRSGAPVDAICRFIEEKYKVNIKVLKPHIIRFLKTGSKNGFLQEDNRGERFKISKGSTKKSTEKKRSLSDKQKKVKMAKKPLRATRKDARK